LEIEEQGLKAFDLGKDQFEGVVLQYQLEV
jgi:hypothetical protein